MDANPRETDRRRFLNYALGTFGVITATSLTASLSAEEEKDKETEEEVAPAEDLMREHGVLNRILLIYDESVNRLGNAKPDIPMDVLASSAQIVRSFIEDYHEKLEENYLFPRFKKAGQQVELVSVLLAQHQAGRDLTDQIMVLSKQNTLSDDSGKRRLSDLLRSFNRMYRPHEAREDTVLFPAFKKIVSPHEYGALGEDFEKKEHQLFGDDGFEKIIDQVAALEKKLGIYDLSKFTPKT